MFNRSGVRRPGYGNVVQILANVELQASVGCIVPQSLGVSVGSKLIAKAEQRARVAEVKAEALLLGANAEYIDDIVTLAMSKIAQNAGTDAKTAITEIKTKYAAFFKQEEKEDDGNSVGKRGTGSSIKNESGKGKKGSGSIKEGLGKRLATARVGSTNKSSFWS